MTLSCRHVRRQLPTEMYPRVLHACCNTYAVLVGAQPVHRRLQRVQWWRRGVTHGVQQKMRTLPGAAARLKGFKGC